MSALRNSDLVTPGSQLGVSVPVADSSSPSPTAAGASNFDPAAKATKGKAGTAGTTGPVRRSTAGTGLRVGAAGADQPATSEHMDVTGGESAATFSSSGDGFGIQQPGSNTSGDRLAMTAGSGRARDRAMCPAVTGNSSCGGAESGSTTPSTGVGDGSNNVGHGDMSGRNKTVPSAGVAPGPQDSIPYPVSSIPPAPVHSVPSPDTGAVPLFSSVDPDFETDVAALEAEWRRTGIAGTAFTDSGIPEFLRRNSNNVAPFMSAPIGGDA